MSTEIGLPKSKAMEENMIHPIEFVQKRSLQLEEAQRMNRIRTTHGLGAASEVALTELTLLGSRRVGSLPSSNALYHSYRGDLTDITVFDVYGLPENDPNVQPSSRALAEKAIYGKELTMKALDLV